MTMATDSWDTDVGYAAADCSVEEESLESLEAKLSEYQNSLQDVKSALKVSPDEPELEKLITDLQELVSLYEDLVELRTKTEPKKRRIENTTVVAVPSEAQAESETLAPAAVDVKNLKPLLNRSCYAFYEGIVYTATVIEVHPVTETETIPRVTVQYIGWGNEEMLPVAEVQFLPSVHNLTVGAACWAINPTDGQWYLAKVSRKENGSIFIRFRDSTESIAIANDQVSTRPPAACIAKIALEQSEKSSGGLAVARPVREVITPAGYRIPEKLTIKPQDPEKIKQMKKKKISLIKKEQRKEIIEEEARVRQCSWQNHSQKAVKKLKTKQSIFRTTDNPEGKVGVTGSGSKMTQFVNRSRHEYEEIEEEL